MSTGSGSKTKHVAKKHNAAFSYEAQGFTKVIYLKSGEIWIEFWTLSDEDQERGILVFQKKIANIEQNRIIETGNHAPFQRIDNAAFQMLVNKNE